MMQELQIPSVPHLVHIETTYGCNCNCVFCYNPRREQPFNKIKMDRIVHSIYESWVPHVYLIGGEPSLLGVRQLNEYVELLAQRSSVTIVTNGVRNLIGLSNKLACIGVPLHGDEGVHERHTRRFGGYKQTIRTIESYVAAGFDVRCIPVLTAWNYDQIYNIIAKAHQLGMESVFVDRFEDGGLGSQSSTELKPSLEQFKIALDQMIRARDDFGVAVGFGTAIPYCLDNRLVSERMTANCGVGITFAAINPDGDVRICNQSEIVYGNILDEPIQKIWAKSQLDEFRNLSWVTEPCLSCPVVTDCLCGCKVDCSCSTGFCIDYAIRENPNLRQPIVNRLPEPLGLPETFTTEYRRLVPDTFTKLNSFHAEVYLVTRYQTIQLDELTARIIQHIITQAECDEAELIAAFLDFVSEPEIRSLVSKLIAVNALKAV